MFIVTNEGLEDVLQTFRFATWINFRRSFRFFFLQMMFGSGSCLGLPGLVGWFGWLVGWELGNRGFFLFL